MLSVIENNESNIRSYCRIFNDLFVTAKDDFIFNGNGDKYLDFFAGAGALNYGHNNEFLKKHLVEYIENDGISHGLDFATAAKREFLNDFRKKILEPRNLDYRVQFTSPSGTNANEAAIKLAKKVTGRRKIFSFMGGFHGMSLGSLAATGNKYFREHLNCNLNDVVFMPFPFEFMNSFDTIQYMDAVLSDTSSGVDLPAAIIVETVQAEGGVIPAPDSWLVALRILCDRHKILLICDEVQVGCGRTGKFFSFEHSKIVPDIVTLSKSISGYGLPMALVLHKPELDIWSPGEHSGTFRGNQMAFVTARAALGLREMLGLDDVVSRKSKLAMETLESQLAEFPDVAIRGKGLIIGIELKKYGVDCAKNISKKCFENRLVVECAGREDTVLKLLPPLTISEDNLKLGLNIIVEAIKNELI